MKKYLLGLFAIVVFAITSCNQQPQYYPQQPVAIQQPAQGDPNQFYNDPQYASQQPVQYNYQGQQILIDAALMAYLYTYHIDPGYYYSTHRSYSHFHVYSNGYYSGYSRGYRPTYVSYNHYHYAAPNARYVSRASISRPVTSQRSFGAHSTSTPVRTGGFGSSSRPSSTVSSTPRSSFGSSRSSSSFGSSRSSSGGGGRHR